MKKIMLGILVFVVLLAMTSAVSAAGWAVTAVPSVPGSHPSYFNIEVTSSADQTTLPLGTYTGWCSDSNTFITPGTSYDFTAYSTLIDNPPPPGPAPEDWYKVNYILNNDVGMQWKAIQAAFWKYDGGIPNNWIYDIGDYDDLYADAQANGEGFESVCDPTKQSSFRYAIILYKPGVQTIFLEQTKECTPNVPEFPSMALPVGMLIGLVGVVFVIKTRKQ